MPPFSDQRSIRSIIRAAYVFWTLIFLGSQPSDGAFDGEWGSLFDHYGENLQHVKAGSGDILEKDNGELLLIWDDEVYFQMNPLQPKEGQHEILCNFYTYPKPDESLPRILKKRGNAPNPEVTFVLASMMFRKFLPFHPVYCNKIHYMNYILYGQIHHNYEHFKECPLNGPWGKFKASQIKDKTFKLVDSHGSKHDFDEYKIQKEYTDAQITDIVARTQSRPRSRSGSMTPRPKPGPRVNAATKWQQRMSSFGRQMSRSFNPFSRNKSGRLNN